MMKNKLALIGTTLVAGCMQPPVQPVGDFSEENRERYEELFAESNTCEGVIRGIGTFDFTITKTSEEVRLVIQNGSLTEIFIDEGTEGLPSVYIADGRDDPPRRYPVDRTEGSRDANVRYYRARMQHVTAACEDN